MLCSTFFPCFPAPFWHFYWVKKHTKQRNNHLTRSNKTKPVYPCVLCCSEGPEGVVFFLSEHCDTEHTRRSCLLTPRIEMSGKESDQHTRLTTALGVIFAPQSRPYPRGTALDAEWTLQPRGWHFKQQFNSGNNDVFFLLRVSHDKHSISGPLIRRWKMGFARDGIGRALFDITCAFRTFNVEECICLFKFRKVSGCQHPIWRVFLCEE